MVIKTEIRDESEPLIMELKDANIIDLKQSTRIDSEPPLIQLEHIEKSFYLGEQEIKVLKGVSINIDRGEMVAIVGASGSGKTSLMNIIGCLDVATAGSYKISGQETKTLGSDKLSELRRSHFGFIFQRYHLIPHLTAIENVVMPAIYNGILEKQRNVRAKQLLTSLGLEDKIENRPNQLSGGQQQRVSICRALMNQAEVILADEPTGALDKQSGQDVLNILQQLHRTGKTVIIITHDSHIATLADRIITIDDGYIVSDTGKKLNIRQTGDEENSEKIIKRKWIKADWRSVINNVISSICSKPLRTFLTMLGIMIGTAAVISIEAIGAGAKEASLQKIRALSTNTLYIYSGKSNSSELDVITRYIDSTDVDTLRKEPYIDSVTPVISRTLKLQAKGKESNVTLMGVGTEYFRVRDYQLVSGRGLTKKDVDEYQSNVVIDNKTKIFLFGKDDAIGESIILGNHPGVIVGVVNSKPGLFAAEDKVMRIWTTYTSAQSRWYGMNTKLDHILVRLNDTLPAELAEKSVKNVMKTLHGIEDFSIYNADAIVKTTENVGQMLTLMLVSIAIVALLVGGIGVMNIMLVTVVERTQEIGIRMAVGARKKDIQVQFLLESILLCILGGMLGLVIAYGIGLIFSALVEQIIPRFSVKTMSISFVSSTLIGIIFGFMPARRAAGLHPSTALASE